jgi:predicted MarR family transcription regulator
MADTKKPKTPITYPSKRIVSSSHLADSEIGWQLSELEYAMTMSFNAFSRWMTHCMSSAGQKDFNPLDILILHNVNHRDREKRISDIAFMLNIEDNHTVNYSLKKLIKYGFVSGQKTGKEVFYSTTETGKEICARYGEIRKACLIDAASAVGHDFDELSHIAMILRNISGLYDQASRAAASF